MNRGNDDIPEAVVSEAIRLTKMIGYKRNVSEMFEFVWALMLSRGAVKETERRACLYAYTAGIANLVAVLNDERGVRGAESAVRLANDVSLAGAELAFPRS